MIRHLQAGLREVIRKWCGPVKPKPAGGSGGAVSPSVGPGQSPGGGSGGKAPKRSEHSAFYTLLKHCFQKAFSPILLSKFRIGTT